MNKKDEKKVSAYAQLTGFHRAVPIILIALAVFVTICFFTQEQTGSFGIAIAGTLKGLFSIGGYFIPVLFLVHALFYPVDIQRRKLISRIIFSFVLLFFISAFAHAISIWGMKPEFNAGEWWTNGTVGVGGGFLGGVFAFAIIHTIGHIGLIILAVTVFSIYFTYFLAGEDNPARDFFRRIIFKVLSFFASIEKKIKSKSEKKKTEKKVEKAIDSQIKEEEKRKEQKRKEQKRVEARNEREKDLYDDEFFEVDNGLKEFKINELGINESRSDVDIELNPTLQTKVHLGEKAEVKHSHERKPVTDYGFIVNEPQETPTPSDAKSRKFELGLEDSADNFFANGTVTFDFEKNEKLATKPSTMGPVVKKTPEKEEATGEKVFSEDDIAAARRRMDFELRKAELKKQREREEEERRRAEAFKPSAVEFDINPDLAPKEHVEEKTTTEVKVEEPVAYTPKAEVKVEEPVAYTPEVEVKAEEPVAYTPEVEVKVEEPVAYTPEVDTVIEEIEDSAPVDEFQVEETAGAFEKALSMAANDSSNSEKLDIVFDDEDDFEDDDGPVFSGIEDVPVSDEISAEFSFGDEDDGEDDVEIPPELRNPVIDEYRKMFPMLDEEEKEDKEEKSVETESFASAESFVSDPEVQKAKEPEDDKNLFSYSDDLNDDEPIHVTPAPEKAEEDEPPFEVEDEPEEEKPAVPDYSNFEFPPIDILKKGVEEEDPSVEEEIAENGDKLIDSLAQFDVRASIKSVDRGPRITRYEIVPARGVRVSRVISLFDDIALNLAAEGIRMEAPIPGKSAIGVEIPNKHPSTVFLRDLIESDEFMNEPSKTFACFGKDVTGNPIFGDIAKMPHILIAGATGMGKSVCINSILISILYRARPDEVKFIMVDPKTVEFTMYNGIPHLLVPVVTDAKQAAGALMWAIDEMNRRYELMAKHEVRKLDSYNDLVRENPSLGEPLPKIIIVIDELNDLMQQVRKPVEGLITNITQKARAAGIHMIIGTQRPSVDVITGVIKANVPSRVSCKVTSLTDSRTILDQSGAEKLLDKGDMLFAPVGKPKPLRVQGAFVSDNEVERIMKFLKSNVSGAIYDEKALEEMTRAAAKCTKGKDSDDDGEEERGGGEGAGFLGDKQFLEAVELAIRQGKISTSLIQRKISVGYGKAAKFIDIMEDLGVVSEPNGSKPRDVLVTKSEWEEMLARRSLDD